MQRSVFTYGPQRLLKMCKSRSEISQLHTLMIKIGLDIVPFPSSKLLASCVMVDFEYARSIFQRIENPNLFMCTTMLRGYSLLEIPEISEAVGLFNSIRLRGLSLDQFTFIATLKSCLRRSKVGDEIHGAAVRSGCDLFLNVRNMLISFYSSCGMIQQSHKVFDEMINRRDVVSWGALIAGYVEFRQPAKALDLFVAMQSELKSSSTSTTVAVSVLQASAELTDHSLSESIHGYCGKVGLVSDRNIASSLITTYSNSGRMDSAHKIFRETNPRDVVVWNCIVDGYARSGELEQSLNLLQQMESEAGLTPNAATLVGLLVACASSGNLTLGRHIHSRITAEMETNDTILGTALIDMYSKCGHIDKATEIFDKMCTRDVKSWTAMIAGFGTNGRPKAALELFHQMEEEEQNTKPNAVTFLAALNACSHGGLVAAARECLRRMVDVYGLRPRIEHYGCVVDVLVRSGMVREGYELIENLPPNERRDPLLWRSLLSGCRLHGDVELAELARRKLIEVDGQLPTDEILMSATYTSAGKLPEPAVVDMFSGRFVGVSSVWVDPTFSIGSHIEHTETGRTRSHYEL